MKTTNRYNLPEPLFKALQADEREIQPDRISVTTLIDPPLIRELSIKHFDELEDDASERLWALLGTSIHSVLQKNGTSEDIEVEKKFETLFEISKNKWTIVGRVDLIDKSIKSIEDYKVTSVWSFLLGDKIEWERQLNVYSYLARKEGYEVNHLFINAILRDWQVSKAWGDYPEIPFQRKEIRLWTFEEQEKYVKERLELFSNSAKECTDEEKWKRGGEIALMQKGKKSALRLLTEEEADKITLSEGQHFEKRKVEYMKCKSYCKVRKFCPFNPYNSDKEVKE